MVLPKLLSPLQLLLLLALVSTHASLAEQASTTWAHQAWQTEDGLPQNSVHAILQASDGLIWVATEGGLARFDGYNFQLPPEHFRSDDLCCVVQDRGGDLWVGTSAGLAHRTSHGSQQVGPSAAIRALAATDDGAVLALTADGLLRADKSGGAAPVDLNAPTALARDPDGSVWIASPAGLLRYTHARLVPTGLPGTVAGAPVLSIAPAAGGALWLRTARSVALLRPGFPLHVWQTGRDLPGTRIEALLADPETGHPWVGTNRGLVTLSADAGPSTPIPELSRASILALTRDTEGDLWVGTETAGLHILRPQRFRTLPGLEDQPITSIVETSSKPVETSSKPAETSSQPVHATHGAIWLGTREDGLRVVRDRNIARPPASADLGSQVILALAAGPHQDLWVGTPDGLNHMDPDGRITLLSSGNGLPDDFVRSLLPETDGSVWVGTRRGLAHVTGQHVDRILTREDGLPSDLIGALLETPEHDLWIATLDGLSLLHNGRITTFTAHNGLAGNIVTSLATETSNAPGTPPTLWIGTRDGGLTRFSDGRFVAFHQAGLPASIESMLLHDGSLWMATRKGVLRASLADLARCAAAGPACPLAVSHYGYSDGLPSEDLAALGHPAATVTRAGELWFATPHGVAIAEPGEDVARNLPTPVVLDRMEADGVEQSLTSPALTLPPGQRSLSFTYAGLSYRAPSRVAYRYRLEGFDARWIDAGPRRSAFYTNLPPGPYRFVVEAAGSNGLWSDPAAVIAFRILPPIYRRWWFYALCLALLGSLAYLIYHLRLRRVRAQFAAVLAERNRIAREIHDTLAQDLVAVSLQVEVATQLVRRGNVAAAAEQLDRTRRLVQEGIADARESIWELRATTAEGSLPSRLARVAERARERGVPTDLRIGGTYRPLPTRWESEILRVAGEAVTNSIRHAEATSITVTLDYAPDQLHLSIADNGRGFDPAAAPPAGRHFGMRGMRERAENIRGHLHIQSAPGAGTTVTLRLSLNLDTSADPDPAQQTSKEKRQHG